MLYLRWNMLLRVRRIGLIFIRRRRFVGRVGIVRLELRVRCQGGIVRVWRGRRVGGEDGAGMQLMSDEVPMQ